MKDVLISTVCFLCSLSLAARNPGNITIENQNLRVQISLLGAELQSIFDKNSGTELLWQGDTTYWASRSPVMFPVNVRIKDDRYTYKGKTYNMPYVGLARIFNFKVIATSGPAEAKLEMRSGKETLPYYPFRFTFGVTYRLEGRKLIVQYLVENRGKDTMYFAAGGHPGFNCPLTGGHKRGDYQYSFSEKMTISHHMIAGGLVQPIMLPLLDNENCLPLDDPRIPVNGTGMLITDIPSRQIGVGYRNEKPFVSVDLGDFPNVNLWAPPGVPFVCIEPLVSHHDLADSPAEIEKKAHYVALPDGKSETYRFTIIVN